MSPSPCVCTSIESVHHEPFYPSSLLTQHPPFTMIAKTLSNAFAGAVVASFLLGGVLVGLLVWSRMRLLARRALLVSGPSQLIRPLSTFSPSDKKKPNTYDDLREHHILHMMGMIEMRIGSFVQTCFPNRLVLLTPKIRQDLEQHLQVVEGRLPDYQLLKLLDLHGDAFLRHFIVTAAFDAISMKTSPHTSILQQETLAFLQAAERERETDGLSQYPSPWKYEWLILGFRHDLQQCGGRHTALVRFSLAGPSW